MAKRKKTTKAKPKPKPRITSVSQWVSVRLAIGLVKRLDAYAELETERTGYKITRSRALEKLLAKALDQEEQAAAAELEKFMPPAEKKPTTGLTGKIVNEQVQRRMREAKATRKRARGGRCPKCGTTTPTEIKGRIGSDDTEEVCAECGTPRG